MPADPETAATAKEMFDASAAFPLIWPTIALLRLSNAEAEKGMRGRPDPPLCPNGMRGKGSKAFNGGGGGQ